jgi:hypothetical protein
MVRTAARAITRMAGEEDTMGKAKRLGLLGAVIAVMALVVGAVSPALGSSSRGLRRPHPATPTTARRSACLPWSPSLIQISTLALRASAL